MKWTDTSLGSALHDAEGRLVAKVRPLGVGGVSARWENGWKWDISDQAPKAPPLSAARWFPTLPEAKAAIAARLEADGCCGEGRREDGTTGGESDR